VTPLVRTEDLVDAQEVAVILGLSHRESVSTYQRRYADMPKPVVDRSNGRTRLWLRGEIEAWGKGRRGRGAPAG
jgi:glutathione-regulated potassium-efflux system ancillary protein KefG